MTRILLRILITLTVALAALLAAQTASSRRQGTPVRAHGGSAM